MVEQPANDIGAEPPRRVVLLGASNLTRAIATVVDACHRRWGQPLDIMAALGHGRSYGTRSTVLGRSLPSIADSALWGALAERPPAPTSALVTDIGNDLLYEAPVARIAEWVTRCLDRLQRHEATIVMTRLPVANIDALPAWKFRLLRRLMFPRGRLPFATIAERAHELNARLAELAAERGIPTIEQASDWYGWDPIHLKSSIWPTAWHQILSAWSEAAVDPAAGNPALADMLYLRSRRPHQRWWFGIESRGAQPCARLREGSAVSFY